MLNIINCNRIHLSLADVWRRPLSTKCTVHPLLLFFVFLLQPCVSPARDTLFHMWQHGVRDDLLFTSAMQSYPTVAVTTFSMQLHQDTCTFEEPAQKTHIARNKGPEVADFCMSSLAGRVMCYYVRGTSWTAMTKFELFLTGGLPPPQTAPISQPGGLPIWYPGGLGQPTKTVRTLFLHQMETFLEMFNLIQGDRRGSQIRNSQGIFDLGASIRTYS